MRHRAALTSLTLILVGMLGPYANAQNWVNPSGGSWGNITDWSPPGIPTNPSFDLNSAGYTVTLPSAESAQTLSVLTDNPTVQLSGQTLSVSDVNIATGSSQNGSLTLLGPGNVIANTNNATVAVGGSGTGQLTVNDATINFQNSNGTALTESASSSITIDNGGKIENAENYAVLSGTVDLNDGVLSVATDLSMGNGATLTNGSTLSAFGNMTLDGNFDVDGSSLTSIAGVSTTFHGTLTVSDGGSITGTGVLTLPASTTILSGTVNSIADTDFSGTTTIQLSATTHDPFSGAASGNYAGILDFTLQNSFVPFIGEQFDIFSYLSGGSGTFGAVNLPTLPGGESWDSSHLYSTGVLIVVPEPSSVGLVLLAGMATALRRRR